MKLQIKIHFKKLETALGYLAATMNKLKHFREYSALI